MFNLIKTDFYKLFRMKTFYICAVLAIGMGTLLTWSIEQAAQLYYQISASFFGSTGISALLQGFSSGIFFSVITISLFVVSDFSGTIKNIIPRGFSRINYYISKLLLSWIIALIYGILAAAGAFATGCILWGTGEFTQQVYYDILTRLGVFALGELAMVSLYMFMAFLTRSAAGAIAINFVAVFSVVVFDKINQFVNYIFHLGTENAFNISKYWPYTTALVASPYPRMLERGTIIESLIVLVAYILVFTASGILIFKKRDIK